MKKRSTTDDINDLIAAAQPEGGTAVAPCTKRELETWVRLASGWTPREVAADLGIAQKTVDSHRAALLRRLGVRNNSDLTRRAIELGLEFLAPPTGKER